MRMSRTDRKLWAAARTIPDLGELTARWLEGRIASQPGYMPNCGPDDETRELMPHLAAANRTGYLTWNSQPGSDGTGYDGRRWVQRAAVCGYANQPALDQLKRAAARHGCRLLLKEHMPATTAGGEIVTGFGGQLPARYLRAMWKGIVSDDAYRALKAATQVTVISTDWGPGGTKRVAAVLGELSVAAGKMHR